MSESLRDQLVKAGLATKDAARRAAKQQGKQAKQRRGRGDDRLESGRAHAAKVARDRELERQRKLEAEKKAKQAEIRQLVESNRLPPVEEENFFNFVDGGKIRRLSVTDERRDRIIRGELVIVRHGAGHAVVPATVGERIRSRDTQAVVSLEAGPSSEVDEAYKDYAVPDDLIW